MPKKLSPSFELNKRRLYRLLGVSVLAFWLIGWIGYHVASWGGWGLCWYVNNEGVDIPIRCEELRERG